MGAAIPIRVTVNGLRHECVVESRLLLSDFIRPGLESTAYFGPDRGSTASGVHPIIVEVDPETATFEITRYLVVHDCGTIINPMLVEGLKGVGEAGCIPTGAVFAQAVEDALAGSGVEITEIPLTPNRLFELIEAARK